MKVSMPLAKAEAVAQAIVEQLAPGCDRIEIAGSIRRCKPTIGDIEIVAIPTPRLNLLGDPEGHWLSPILANLCHDGRMRLIKGGDRYRQYALTASGLTLDLFLTTPERWGCIFLIRTGSAEFSKRIVTKAKTMDMRFDDGRLWRSDEAMHTPEEENVFWALDMHYVAPEDRT